MFMNTYYCSVGIMDLMGLMRKYANFMNRRSVQQPDESVQQPFRETTSTTNLTMTTTTIQNTDIKLTNSEEIMLNLQKIAIKKSGMVMELLGFKIEQYKDFLNANIDKATDLTSMFIELKLIYYNTKSKKIHRRELFASVKLPKFLVRHLFEKSYAQNTNKYCDMCVSINFALDITNINDAYRIKYKELVKKKEYIGLLESNDMQFITNVGYDEISQFYDEIIKKNE